MRELLGAAASAQLARELEREERGNLAWWRNGSSYEMEERPKANPLALEVLKKFEERESQEASKRQRAARERKRQLRRAA